MSAPSALIFSTCGARHRYFQFGVSAISQTRVPKASSQFALQLAAISVSSNLFTYVRFPNALRLNGSIYNHLFYYILPTKKLAEMA